MATVRSDTPGRSAEGGGGYLPRQEAEISFPLDRTALLVIDPVNDFLSEGGAAWEMTRRTLKLHDVIEHMKRAIEAARLRSVPVIFAPMAFTEEDYADHQLHRRSGINRLMYERRMFLAGSWGADFHHDLQPAEGEIVLMPHKGMDVFETDLPEHLETLRVTHVVIAGMSANLCCESTGRRAMEAGYDVTYLSDAIGASSILAYEASIHVSYPLIANAVITVDEFIAALTTALVSNIQPGDRVFGSDHGEIGIVDRVVRPSAAGEGYLLVPRGFVFHTDMCIPMEAVAKRAGREVFINVPKPAVAGMPWTQPPTRSARRAKDGPAADEVVNLYRSRSPSARRPATPV